MANDEIGISSQNNKNRLEAINRLSILKARASCMDCQVKRAIENGRMTIRELFTVKKN